MRMEENGRHAVPVSLPPTLDGQVETGGDAGQGVGGGKEVVDHLRGDRFIFLTLVTRSGLDKDLTFHCLPRTGNLASCLPRCNIIVEGAENTETQGSVI